MNFNKKVKYILFLIFLFFQNYAFIRTENFGISALAVYMLIISLLSLNKYYLNINRKFLCFLLFSILVLILGSLVNNLFNLTQIFKSLMTIWLIYVIYIFIKNVYQEGNQEYFWKYYYKIALIMFSYGIYEFLANKYSWPLFMNVFSNNPSYGAKSIYRYYGGWVDKGRLYNLFFEPSAFSVFLVYNFFLFIEMKYIKKSQKRIISLLILFNLYFTYARTGWVTFVYMLIIYFTYKIFKNKAKLLDNIFLVLPFINIALMYFIGLKLFDDLSSNSRTYSAIYYLTNSFTSMKYIFLGHGCGSIVFGDVSEKYVTLSAQNGFSDLIYQYGIVYFTYIFILTKGIINKFVKNIQKHRSLIIGSIGTFCCFASYYNVETLMSLLILIFFFCKEESLEVN